LDQYRCPYQALINSRKGFDEGLEKGDEMSKEQNYEQVEERKNTEEQ